MAARNSSTVRKICIIVGVCLLVSAMAALIARQIGIRSAEEQAKEYVDIICSSIPAPVGTVPESRRDNKMPMLSVDESDFVGILELPRYESVLPVGAKWGNTDEYPCRFSGSVYDKTLKIGATSQKGQYDFYREISVGDSVFFTDVEGNRYSYSVTDICYESNADQATLDRKKSALTLFIKNLYGFDYIIIYCDVSI